MNDHARLRELFVKVCDLPPLQQSAWIEEHCGDEPQLRAELEVLLQKDITTAGLFADNGLTEGIEFHLQDSEAPDSPATIGKYRVKKILGEGGMGIVYLARQQHPQRDVALKVIRHGIPSRELLKRFEFEAAVLGKLQHPQIAQIYEAGFDDKGWPFFAMEYVEGLPLNEYPGNRDLSVDEILKLFLQICDAIHHAHQRGIIHRDLKPGNVLVRSNGQPVILDFGVARAVDSEFQLATGQTSNGQLIGTLPYMSPEQIDGDLNGPDTRSDVYSLGVILYEMLSGHHPHEIQNEMILKAASIVSNERPRPVSDYNRQYRGDLNTIVLKALTREPELRYPSAFAFAEDIRRLLNHEPILARSATTWYQIRKFARRNRTLVVAAGVSLLLLVGGIVGTTIGLLKAHREADRLTAVNEFVSGILVSPDPAIGNANVRFAKVLRDAVEQVPNRFGGHPELEADVCLLLGEAFSRLTMVEDAIPLHRRAYDLRREVLGPEDQATRDAGLQLVSAMLSRNAHGTIELAEQLLDETPDELRNEHFAPPLRSNIAHANSRLGNRKLAEQQLRSILEIAPRSTHREIDLVKDAKATLAGVLRLKYTRGDSAAPEQERQEAIQLYREAIEQAVQLHGEDDSNTLFNMLNLVDCLADGDDLTEAEQLALSVIELAPVRHSPEHELSIRPLKDMTFIRYRQNRYQEAADFQIKAVEMTRQRDGNKGVSLIVMMVDALPVIEAAGRFAVGGEYARFLLDELNGGYYDRLKTEHQLFLARFLSGMGEVAEAEQLFDQVLQSGELETNANLMCQFRLFMGEHQFSAGNQTAARELFMKARELCQQVQKNSTPRPHRIGAALLQIDRLEENDGESRQTEKWPAPKADPENQKSLAD